MNQRFVLIQSFLWASAIIVAASVGTSAFFTLLLLPAAGSVSLLLQVPRSPCLG